MFGYYKGGKRKQPPENTSGTGYGGQQGDTKKLIAGRRKAERKSNKDDKANIKFLKQTLRQLSNVRKKGVGLDREDKTRVSSTLANIFRSQSPSDWDDRQELYKSALDLSRALCNETHGAIFGDKDDQEGILYWLLDFSEQSKQILKQNLGAATKKDDEDEDVISGWTKEDQDDVMLANQVSEVADMALKISRQCLAKKPEAELSVISLSERYQSKLGPLRFDSVDSMQNHFFLKKVPNASPALNTRMLFKELASYRAALPVEYGSSCFCRVINSRLDLLRVMITGPDDTPYANGCFLFDINLPTNYPKVNPLVQFLTTGGGKIRFNPNLYNCGKVCLSLLGTWSGPGWISGQSTLLQVLISIQSLILVPDPYFNEPGWERDRGTARGDNASKAYNQKIRTYTVSAAIESHLSSILANSNQYPEFESAMIKHFLEKRSLIQKELWSWVKDDNTLVPSVTNVCNLFEQLASRERGQRSKRSRAALANRSNEPIVLDDADVSHVSLPKKSTGALKSNEMIEIDLSDNDEEERKGKPKSHGGKGASDDLIDLT